MSKRINMTIKILKPFSIHLLVLICMSTLIFVPNFTHAHSIDDSHDHTHEHKPIDIELLEKDFADNSVLVTLTENETRKFLILNWYQNVVLSYNARICWSYIIYTP